MLISMAAAFSLMAVWFCPALKLSMGSSQGQLTVSKNVALNKKNKHCELEKPIGYHWLYLWTGASEWRHP